MSEVSVRESLREMVFRALVRANADCKEYGDTLYFVGKYFGMAEAYSIMTGLTLDEIAFRVNEQKGN